MDDSHLVPIICHEYPYRVRYADTDRMEYMYNGHYLRLFEIGRTELLRWAGVPYVEIEASGLLLPVLEAHVIYRSPAFYDDLLTIETTCGVRYAATLRLDYRILRASDVIAEGYTVHTFVHRQRRRAVRPPQWFFERLLHVAR
ncbi:MAG: acyl-CoA thioesterase [Chlorobi bacterium]|nr:acyl-CoA thioesterase [Chlorobiota bacterium]